ncbi:AMP-dependent synthetase [Sulfuricaulis limicola]|uniref:AMP-dependent synthetase n=1 Tax=Sulfuricaulis limicola TaxID=1620215 RepID=A0A1B4XJQ9_9GAMM|nr:AMP-dependent synthetase/ligase [Sulfuricaulis limicola]BAV35031.1 AMP-dependent synthetase [Sulfuricaulis limicola]
MNLTDQSSLSDLFVERVRETPDAPAYRQFDGSGWKDLTWGETGREVMRWQAAFRKEGLKAGDRVALCLHNRVEWVLFDQAALGLGLVTVPLYFDDRPDNMAWCLNDAGARLLLLEDGRMWAGLRDQVKTIERVVSLDAADAGGDKKVTGLEAWLPPAAEDMLARSAAAPNDLATIVYTSGTTGRPKGVMLSHRNILSNVLSAMKALPAYTTDRFLSFLPLSHMFERTCGYYSAMWAGAQTVYARSITLLADDIREQRPTILISVPRIFERIYSRMQEAMAPGSPKRKLFEKATEVGWRRFRGEAAFADKLLWPLLKLLVAKKLYRRLGGRIRMIVVGGAAFAPHLSRVFIGLGLPIIQGYGLTETSPVLAANRMNDNDPTSVGRALEGIELRCDDKGELLARGPCVMLGYWNKPEATAAMIDRDGWLHTGDLVAIRGGNVYITGRVKDIIVLSNGEKVPPTDAEAAILRDAAFEQVMVVGEGRPKLGLLAVSKITDAGELCRRANAQLRDFPGYARIHHLARMADPWTVENGLLTPTLKAKRNEIEKRYAREIEAMYAGPDLCQPKNNG